MNLLFSTLSPIPKPELIPIHPNAIAPGAKKRNYNIPDRRKKQRRDGTLCVKVPPHTDVGNNDTLVSYPEIARRYGINTVLMQLVWTVVALTVAVGVSTLLFDDLRLTSNAGLIRLAPAIIFLIFMWLIYSWLSRHILNWAPADFITHGAYYHKEPGLFADVHRHPAIWEIGNLHGPTTPAQWPKYFSVESGGVGGTRVKTYTARIWYADQFREKLQAFIKGGESNYGAAN